VARDRRRAPRPRRLVGRRRPAAAGAPHRGARPPRLRPGERALHLPGVFTALERLTSSACVRVAMLGRHGLSWPWESLHVEALAWFDHWLKGRDTGILGGAAGGSRRCRPASSCAIACRSWRTRDGFRRATASGSCPRATTRRGAAGDARPAARRRRHERDRHHRVVLAAAAAGRPGLRPISPARPSAAVSPRPRRAAAAAPPAPRGTRARTRRRRRASRAASPASRARPRPGRRARSRPA
jgi:hypothetical protein